MCGSGGILLNSALYLQKEGKKLQVSTILQYKTINSESVLSTV